MLHRFLQITSTCHLVVISTTRQFCCPYNLYSHVKFKLYFSQVSHHILLTDALHQDLFQGLCTGLSINYAAGKGCECAQDHCDDRTPDQNFSIYLASEQRTLLAYSLLQDGRHCTQYVNLRVSGLWTRGSAHACMLLATGPGKPLGCQSNHFQYRASNEDCGCGADARTEQTQNDFWAIYSIEPTSQKFAGQIPQQSLVYDGHTALPLQTFALRSCGHSEIIRSLCGASYRPSFFTTSV